MGLGKPKPTWSGVWSKKTCPQLRRTRVRDIKANSVYTSPQDLIVLAHGSCGSCLMSCKDTLHYPWKVVVIRAGSWGLEGSTYLSWRSKGWLAMPHLLKTGCEVSFFEDTQKLAGHSTEKTALAGPAWAGGWTGGSPAGPSHLCHAVTVSFCVTLPLILLRLCLDSLWFLPQLSGLWNMDINTTSYVPWKNKYTKDWGALSKWGIQMPSVHIYRNEKLRSFFPRTVQIALKCEKTISVIMFLKPGSRKLRKSQV